MLSSTASPVAPVELSDDERLLVECFRALSLQCQLQLASLLEAAQAQGGEHDKHLIAEAFARFLPK